MSRVDLADAGGKFVVGRYVLFGVVFVENFVTQYPVQESGVVMVGFDNIQ